MAIPSGVTVSGDPALQTAPTATEPPRNIDSVTVNRGSSGSFGYSVETSTDGSSWHVVATAPATSTGTDQFTFKPTQAQFVRLELPGGNGASAPDIDELSVSAP